MIQKTIKKLEGSYELYQLCRKQYLGIGSLLQFIPGTNANKARNQLINDLAPALNTLIEEYSNKPSIADDYVSPTRFYFFTKYSYLLKLYSYIHVGSLFTYFK